MKLENEGLGPTRGDLEDSLKCFEAYLGLLDGAKELELSEFLLIVRAQLAEVFLRGLGLPHADESVEYPDSPLIEQVEKSERTANLSSFLGEFDFYWELNISPNSDPLQFDVLDSDSLGSGSLADDLYDIYWDLYEGLQEIKTASESSGIVKLNTDFRIHWGQHAAESLARIHSIISSRI